MAALVGEASTGSVPGRCGCGLEFSPSGFLLIPQIIPERIEIAKRGLPTVSEFYKLELYLKHDIFFQIKKPVVEKLSILCWCFSQKLTMRS